MKRKLIRFVLLLCTSPFWAAAAGDQIPPFAERAPYQTNDYFLVWEGYPKITEPSNMPGTFASRGEYFYSQPLPLSANDKAEIEKIIGACQRLPNAKNPLREIEEPQAAYRISWGRPGFAYDIFVYASLNFLMLARSDQSNSPLQLDDASLQKLLSLLKPYRKNPVPG